MSRNIDDLPVGGMGLKIMSDLSDKLSYTRNSEHQNCLSIEKRYEQQQWAQSQNSRSTPLQQIRLQVNTDLGALDQVLEWFGQLEHQSIPRKTQLQCQLMLAEGFTNAVRHAHRDLPPETPIELELRVFPGRLELRIWDYGEFFDLEAKLRESELGQSPDGGGGRGINLLGKLPDQVSYRRTADERNCLVMVKNIASPVVS